MAQRNILYAKRGFQSYYECVKFMNITVRKQSVWTTDRIVKSPYKDVEIPNCTLHDYVWQNLDKWPERTASVCSESGRGYTYEQAFKLSTNFSANLRNKLKLRNGDVVAVMLPNIPEFPLVTLGILGAGAVISTINPIYTAHEVQRQITMADATVIVTLPQIIPVIKEALKLAKRDLPIITIKSSQDLTPQGTILFNELVEDVHVDKSCLKEVKWSANDICFLPYSSGTTGLPKGVELSHRNIVSNCQQLNEPAIKCHNETTANHQDAVMAVLPFFHIYAATVIMFHKMSHGIKLATLAKFQPEPFLKALETQKTNVLFVAPPLVLLMASHPSASSKTYQYLTTVMNGAAPVSSTDIDRFIDKVQRKIDFRQGYGLTETSPVVTMTPKGMENLDCIGNALPNTDLKIVSEDLTTLGPNETGQLLIRGPQVMKGYRNNPQANSETFTSDGWFKSGDLCSIDDEGVVTISDRLKELIKVKGFQVPPAELEAILREHPAVIDAGVIGVPHPTKGEAPKAFIVLKPGHNAEAEDITSFVEERVAPYKRIDTVVFLDSIPKSVSGKILRRELKEKYGN